jgi:hypothetical protein
MIAVIEMSQSKWLVAAVVPGVERQPLKKLDADEAALLKLLHRWRDEAEQAGRQINRIVVAYNYRASSALPLASSKSACAASHHRFIGEYRILAHSVTPLGVRSRGIAAVGYPLHVLAKWRNPA